MEKDGFDGGSRVDKNGVVGLLETLRQSVAIALPERDISPQCLCQRSP